MRARWAVPVAASLLLAGCGDSVVHVESDTTWAGTVGGSQVSGRGDESFTLPADGSASRCASIHKTTEAGTLRVVIEQSTWFGLGNTVDFEGTTTAPMGAVSGCAA